MTPGPLDVYVQFHNLSASRSEGYFPQVRLTKERPMSVGANEEGWQRWEVALPPTPQLR